MITINFIKNVSGEISREECYEEFNYIFSILHFNEKVFPLCFYFLSN